MSFLILNQQRQSTEGYMKYWPQPVKTTHPQAHPILIHHRIVDQKGMLLLSDDLHVLYDR